MGATVWLFVAILAACGPEPPGAAQSTGGIVQTPAYEGTIVAMGNSLTAGLGVDEDKAYPALLESKLQRNGYNYRVINAGVSGETSSGALSRVQWVVASLQPDIVILETGANDGLRGVDPQLLERNLDALCTRLKANGVHVLLAGMLMLPNLGPEYTQSFATIYPRIAQKHGVVFMPFFLEGVAGVNELNQPDKIHPTAAGYVRIVENLYPFVVEVIERERAAGTAVQMR